MKDAFFSYRNRISGSDEQKDKRRKINRIYIISVRCVIGWVLSDSLSLRWVLSDVSPYYFEFTRSIIRLSSFFS